MFLVIVFALSKNRAVTHSFARPHFNWADLSDATGLEDFITFLYLSGKKPTKHRKTYYMLLVLDKDSMKDNGTASQFCFSPRLNHSITYNSRGATAVGYKKNKWRSDVLFVAEAAADSSHSFSETKCITHRFNYCSSVLSALIILKKFHIVEFWYLRFLSVLH